MRSRSQDGLTITEIVVCVAVFGTLLAVGLAGLSSIPASMKSTLNNMRLLHLASQQMVLDGASNGNTNPGWPGDTGDTMSEWAERLVKGNYLTTNDLRKLLSGPGVVVTPEEFPHFLETAVLVYAIKEEGPSNTVAFSTANFTNTANGGMPLNAQAKPYGDRGFAVIRKAGDGAVLRSRHVGDTNLIGAFAPLLRP